MPQMKTASHVALPLIFGTSTKQLDQHTISHILAVQRKPHPIQPVFWSGRPKRRVENHLPSSGRASHLPCEYAQFAEPSLAKTSTKRKHERSYTLRRNIRRAQKQWATRCKDYTAQEWSRIIWSDETYIYIGDDRGTVWVT